MKVYTPSGMYMAYRQLSKELGIRHRLPKLEALRDAVYVLNDGRHIRGETPAKIPFMDQPAAQKADRGLLEREIKAVERVIQCLAELSAHQPPIESANYAAFVNMYDKFAVGINHHLKGMQHAALSLLNVEALQQKMEAMKQTNLARPVVFVSEPIIATVHHEMPPLHRAAIEAGADIEKSFLNLDARAEAIEKLKIILENAGPNINVRDEETGNTVLHLATEMGLTTLVEALLIHTDIDPNILNKDEKKAVEIAKIKANENRNDYANEKGDATKVQSKYKEIQRLLIPSFKRDTLTLMNKNKKDNTKTERKESWRTLVKKQIQNVFGLGMNLSLMGPKDVVINSINKNYLAHGAMAKDRISTDKVGKSELTKLLNPFTAISTGLSILNIGARALIDNIYCKLTNSNPAGKSAVIPTLLKIVLTAPLTIAESVASALSDTTNLVTNAIVDNVRFKQTTTEKANVSTSDISLSNSTLLTQQTLSEHPVSVNVKHQAVSQQPAVSPDVSKVPEKRQPVSQTLRVDSTPKSNQRR
jgi:hypothetical protein